MVQVLSTFVNPGDHSTIPKATLITDAENDFTRLTGHGGHSGAHDSRLTNIGPECYGGQPTNCSTEGISGDAWQTSILLDPVLLTYTVLPLTTLITTDHGFTQDVGSTASDEWATNNFVGCTDSDKCHTGFQLFRE
jgi:hypothetical protein